MKRQRRSVRVSWERAVAVLAAVLALQTWGVTGASPSAAAAGSRGSLLSADNPSRGPDTSKDLRRFVFASCSRTHLPQPWEAVAAVEPELFVWLGDIVYADVRGRRWWKPFGFESRPLQGMARMYDKLLMISGYHQLVRYVIRCGQLS